MYRRADIRVGGGGYQGEDMGKYFPDKTPCMTDKGVLFAVSSGNA
jgi:hypothetical protein